VLQTAGLVTQSKKAQWRLCRLEAAPIQAVANWVWGYRDHWSVEPSRPENPKST
jgi:hypothetical protein